MRIHAKTILRLNDDGSFTPVEDVFYDYFGPVMQFKKERETVAANARDQRKIAGEERAYQVGQRAKAEPFVTSLEATAPGQLSPYAAAQLASNRDNIGRTYRGLREATFRTLGQRGLTSAPSGLAQTGLNALGRSEEQSDTEAYRAALGDTYNQGLTALNYRTGQQEQGAQGTQANYGGSTQSAEARSRMGSGFGDVMQGIGSAVDIATSFIPAAKAAKTAWGGIGAAKKLATGASSGTGYYGSKDR